MRNTLLLILSFFISVTVIKAQKIAQVSTIAGSGVNELKDGTGLAASFSESGGICKDHNGNIYVSDITNHVIRKITPAGVVSVFAGSGKSGFTDGQGTSAQFNSPVGLCVDPSGNVYVADFWNYSIRKITPGGLVTTFAGTGKPDHKDGQGTSAAFFATASICRGPDGSFYVSEYIPFVNSGFVRKITPTGSVSTYCRDLYFSTFLCVDGAGNLYVTTMDRIEKLHQIEKIDGNGKKSLYARGTSSTNHHRLANDIGQPFGLTIDSQGNIYYLNRETGILEKIGTNDSTTHIAGNRSLRYKSQDGAGTQASFNSKAYLTIDAQGTIYMADANNYNIRKIEFISPPVPQPKYLDLPTNLCMGSTINKNPSPIGEAGLKLDIDSFMVSGIKAIAKGKNGEYFVVNANDSIFRYSSNGTLLRVYNDLQVVTNIKDITVDEINRVYVIGDGWQSNSVFRMDSSGAVELGYSSPEFYFTGPIALAIGPDGYIYVTDTLNGNVDKVDPTTGTASFYAGPFQGLYNITDVDFGKDGKIYLTSKNDQKIWTRKYNTSDNFQELIPGIDTMGYAFTKIEVDTSGAGTLNLISESSNKLIQIHAGETNLNGGAIPISSLDVLDYSLINFYGNNPKGSIFNIESNGIPTWMVANGGSGSVTRISLYSYTIAPALPAGLSFNVRTGKISGVPLVSAAATTYTVTVENSLGKGTFNFSFSVDPPGPVSNAVGAKDSRTETHGDGYVVNYFENNNCAELLQISDEAGGSTIGKTKVTQTVFPTIATFSSGTFVPRVNEISTQNTEAGARLKMYYTYLDILHFNQSNGSDPDLENDTTKTMQVGVIQLHKDSTGIIKQIKHNPVIATWSRPKQVWVIDFPVEKFSTFYVGETTEIDSFDCRTTADTIHINACGNYKWRNKIYTSSGIYNEIIANYHGCDSLITLNVTIKNDLDITKDFNKLTSNTSGAVYQWLYCDSNYAAIPGATSQVFFAKKAGNYALALTYNSCTDTSSCYSVDSINYIEGISGVDEKAAVNVYPNPGNGVFTVHAPQSSSFIVYNMMGQILMEGKITEASEIINLSRFAKGVYYLRLTTNQEQQVILKLVKND